MSRYVYRVTVRDGTGHGSDVWCATLDEAHRVFYALMESGEYRRGAIVREGPIQRCLAADNCDDAGTNRKYPARVTHGSQTRARSADRGHWCPSRADQISAIAARHHAIAPTPD